MKANVKKSILCNGLMIFILSSQLGFASEYTVDKSHSNVGCVVRHLVSKVPCNFKDFDASFSFDANKPEETKVKATIKASSINTDNTKRDEHLRSDDFFAVKKFPLITFVSSKVVKAEEKKYKMTGDLTMHGVTKPVTLDVELLGEVNDPWGGHRAGFTATGKIDRKDFGINWNKTLDQGGVVLSEDVDLVINLEAVEKPSGKAIEKAKTAEKK